MNQRWPQWFEGSQRDLHHSILNAAVSAWVTRLIVTAALVIAFAVGTPAWMRQANNYERQLAEQSDDYGKKLAEKDRMYTREREEAAAAALNQLAEQQDARRALEARWQDQTQTHGNKINDAQQAQACLRDRLATAALRLSVLVDAGTFAAQSSDGGLREAPAPKA